jgi:uncharacterized protein
MFFHVVLTTHCDLQCKYCFGEAEDDMDDDFCGFNVNYSLPANITYDIADLKRFCGGDRDCVVTFYGGEPLLCADKIGEIMDCVDAKAFMVQTNGLHLDRLESNYVNRFHTILVSLDGDEALTDYYRGKGTFKRVMDNLKLITRNGFGGELIARMTVMERTDIYQQVRWLLDNPEFCFSSVHWQLNAGFWANDYARRVNFERWSRESYDVGVQRLAELWVKTMEKKGEVLRLYPFLGIAHSLLNGEEKSLLRCGGGWINYAIQTDGYIVPCPTMWGMKDYYLGHVSTADPLKLKRVLVGEPCLRCDILGLCGGRCLYATVAKRWKPEAYRQVCSTVRNLIEEVREQLPNMRRLIDEGSVSLKDFDYVKYNGCEIIP